MEAYIETYYIPLLKSVILLIILFSIREVLKRTVRNFAKKFERVEHRTGLIMKHINFAIFGIIMLGLIFIWGVSWPVYKLAVPYWNSFFCPMVHTQ